MKFKLHVVTVVLGCWALVCPISAEPGELTAKGANLAESDPSAILWREPEDIATRDLFYGAGGKDHEPSGTFTFVKEDAEASNPKFTVRDENGVEWKVKLGPEARSETAATRLIWAVGYFTDEDYLVPSFKVANMPRLHRGQHLVASDGTMANARLERVTKGEKAGNWKWRHVSFKGTREYDGLRVMMSLINNWDLKDVNTAIYATEQGKVFVVSDLGASFGSSGFSFPAEKTRSNLEAYRDSEFVREIDAEHVDFNTPARPALIRVFAFPDFISRMKMRSLGRDISREHAKWIGQVLARLSPEQIRNAFRGAGYPPEEVEGFAKVIETRIAQLNEL